MFYFNFSNIIESYAQIKETAAQLLSHSNNSFPYMSYELPRLLKETGIQLSKLLPTSNRNKRGLINGLGKVIKFISGNLDQDDLEKLESQIKNIKTDHSEEIQHINKLLSFSNSIAQKFYKEMNHVNSNMDIIQRLLSRQEIKIGLLEHYQFTVICVNRLRNIINTIENTINLSFQELTNVQLFSQEDVTNIVNHLRSIYAANAIIHTDPYHVYENLKFSKTQVVITNEGLVVVLSVPITDGSNYHLYAITPVPTINKSVLIPSEKYYLQGPTSKWSTTPCMKGTKTFVCIYYNIRATQCNLTQTSGCEFAHVSNDVKLFQLLNNAHILFFSTQKETVLQTCADKQTSTSVQGPYVLYSNLSCPISFMSITLEPKPTNFIKSFPLIYVQKVPIVNNKQIQFHYSHLDVNQFKLDLLPMSSSPTVLKQENVFHIGYFFIIIG